MKVYKTLEEVFQIKVVTLNRIIISTLRKLQSKLSQKNLFRDFQAIRCVLVDNNRVKGKRFTWPMELFSAKLSETFFLEMGV